MRMGIDVGRWSVRGPAGMSDADVARCGCIFERCGQMVDASGSLGDRDFTDAGFAWIGNAGDPGTIVAAIFQATEARQNEVDRWGVSDIADDSAHDITRRKSSSTES